MTAISGKDSRRLWDLIHGLSHKHPDVWEAMYALGCACQTIDAKVSKVKKAPFLTRWIEHGEIWAGDMIPFLISGFWFLVGLGVGMLVCGMCLYA